MDTTQDFSNQVQLYQEPMNAVIDRFESPVQQFYCGTTVLVTGGSGFIGMQLVEKLFRSAKIEKMYLLLRPRKGKTMQDRLNYMLKDPVYDGLRMKQPNFAEKIVTIESEMRELGLGLQEKDRAIITQEVDIIFHVAATIRFDEPLRKATLINVQGTREALKLAKDCKKLKSFVYVSTAYTHATFSRVNQEVLEDFYSCPVPPEAMIAFAESVEESRLNTITENLIKDWPNTYTFTKTLAEDLVRRSAEDGLPACIVRPAIVISARYEPIPGWLNKNAMSGPSAILVGAFLGVLHVFPVDKKKNLAFVPVDYTNNAIIAAAWDSTQLRAAGNKQIPIYTVADSTCFMPFEFISRILHFLRRTCTNKSIWYCYVLEIKTRELYWVLKWFLHFLPAYVLDLLGGALGVMPKEMPSLVKAFKLLDKQAKVYSFFLHNEWYFQNHNLRAMISRMSEEDRAIYNCDLRDIDYAEYAAVWGMGVRRFLIKDGLVESDAGARKQVIFKYANIMYLCLLFYMIWWVLCTIFWYVQAMYQHVTMHY